MSSVTSREQRLLPSGVPRWIRCYDNGGQSCDRYTVVYTNIGRVDPARRGGTMGVGMSGAPFYPQGFGQHFEYDHQIDRPKHGHLGRKIAFADLPPDCQALVLRDYRELWSLSENQTGVKT